MISISYLFNLYEQKIINFPDSRQSTDYSCGAACVQSILRYYDKLDDKNEKQIIELVKTNPTHGTNISKIINIFKNVDLSVEAKTMTIQELIKYIDDDIPVIVCCQAWGDGNDIDYTKRINDGHYMVAIGYDQKNIIFDDPSIHSNRGKLSFSELNKRWHDIDPEVNNILDHFGIAVIGTKKYDQNKLVAVE